MEAPHKGNQHSAANTAGDSKDTSEEKTVEIEKLKNRTRAFTGAFVGMVSPVLLAIVLKKTNLKGVGKYQGTRMIGDFIDLFQEIFPFLAAITLQVGMMPFLCLMVSEACASSLPDRVNHITERLLITSKMVVFFSNILLMFLACGVLVFIHKNAWFSWLVVSACFIMAVIAILLHIYSCCWWYRRADKDVGCTDYHSKLEHSLEFSAGITAMMFLVLGSVVLEGLLKSTQLPQPDLALTPTPSEGPTTKEPGMFLGATLFLSFLTSMIAAFLMNVWTIPLVVLAGAHVKGLNIALATLAVMVVFLITWDGLQLKAWLTLLAPAIILLVLLKRCNYGDGNIMQHQEEEKEKKKEKEKEKEEELEAGLPTPGEKIQQQDKETIKPAPLELTKVAFTGFLAVAVSGITTASPERANKVFVFCAAATVVLGLLWRLLTHDNDPSPAVRKAANHSSFLAQIFLFCAGISFGVMAVNAAK